MSKINSQETISKILNECKKVAVVGLSSNPFRPSNGVAAFMQEKGCRIFPVNPNETIVLGEKAVAKENASVDKNIARTPSLKKPTSALFVSKIIPLALKN